MTTSCLLTALSSHACIISRILMLLFFADAASDSSNQVWFSRLPRVALIESTAVHSHKSSTFLLALESLVIFYQFFAKSGQAFFRFESHDSTCGDCKNVIVENININTDQSSMHLGRLSFFLLNYIWHPKDKKVADRFM